MARKLIGVVAFAILCAVANGATVSIVSPQGGEIFVVGQTQYVRLAPTTTFKSVRVELSRDGGPWTLLGVIDNTVKKELRNVLQFTVAEPTSANCVIRATAIMPKVNIFAVTGGFSITTTPPPPAGTPSGPAGGDLTGAYPNPSIAPNAITNAKLADGSVTLGKINSGVASSGFVLSADGSGGASFTAPPTGSGISHPAFTQLYLKAGNGTAANAFTVPAGLTALTVEAWGGGNGGSGGNAHYGTNVASGASGAPGHYYRAVVNVTPGIYTVTVGAGGTAGAGGAYGSMGQAGGSGGDSFVAVSGGAVILIAGGGSTTPVSTSAGVQFLGGLGSSSYGGIAAGGNGGAGLVTVNGSGSAGTAGGDGAVIVSY